MPSLPLIRIATFITLAFIFSLAGFQTAASVSPQTNREIRVTYVAHDRVYLSGGQDDDVNVGNEFELIRNGDPVARIRVIQVSDTSASASVTVRKRHIHIGDTLSLSVPLKGNAKGVHVPDSQSAPMAEEWDNDTLQHTWRQALTLTPPVRIRHKTGTGNTNALTTLSARAGTELHQYAYIQSRSYLRTEQTLWFTARGGNQILSGLSWAVDGMLRGRYDDGADQYLGDQRLIPLIRRLSIVYRARQQPLTLKIGRFAPDIPIIHTIDGIEVDLTSRRFTIAVFGGLMPDEQRMTPAVARQAFGVSCQVTPLSSTHYTLEAAAVGQLSRGEFYRAALGINNWFYTTDGLHFTETAVIDFVSASNENQSQGDVTLTRAAIDTAWPLSDRIQMDIRARYDMPVIFTQDYDDLPNNWISYVDRIGQARLESGMPIITHRAREVRPFVFGHADLAPGKIDGGTGGVGISIHDDRFFSTQTGITTVIDYGGGTGQTLNIDVTLNTPLHNHTLQLLSGLYTTWHWTYQSDVHTLRNLAFLMLQGHIRHNLDVFANWQTGYDHALVRLTYPFGIWTQFQVGIAANY